jgi:succinate-semialdehyde dehydrogenase/glutarate-semialdehyde dehydrogenase
MNAIQAGIAPGSIGVHDPATNELLGQVPCMAASEVADAVQRAALAQPRWAATAIGSRLELLRNFQLLLCDRKNEVAATITREAGKPQAEALATEVLVVLDTVNFLLENTAAFLRPEHIAHANPIMKLKRGWLLRQPFGVIGIISPWNYPFSLPSVQTLAALVTGNAVVLKPSELTPYASLKLQELLYASGLDHALLQVVTGDGGTGASLLNANIQKMVFTGSVATGQRVAQAAAAKLLPVVLELGGKDPMIVLDDADIEVASSAAVWGAFMNAGQTCLSVERCYVHDPIYEGFLKACAAKAGKLRLGHGSDAGTDMGPLIHERQLNTVQAHVEDALDRGARLVAGGARLPALGPNFFAPTILADVDHSMRIMREETFGPVLPVCKFKTEEEAIRLANDSIFGLAASVFTSNRRRGEELAARIDAGTVMVNDVISCFGISEAPHGGVKASGIGRTHGRFGLEEMVWPKYVDSDRLPKMRKLWWYGYGPQFLKQMSGFIDLLFARKLTTRIRGSWASTLAYFRRRVL